MLSMRSISILLLLTLTTNQTALSYVTLFTDGTQAVPYSELPLDICGLCSGLHPPFPCSLDWTVEVRRLHFTSVVLLTTKGISFIIIGWELLIILKMQTAPYQQWLLSKVTIATSSDGDGWVGMTWGSVAPGNLSGYVSLYSIAPYTSYLYRCGFMPGIVAVSMYSE